MGRFGNVLLVNGEPDLALSRPAGEVVRLYLDNTANTRVFKVALPGARMKLVGGDSGRVRARGVRREVVLAPSERAVVDVLFEQAGEAGAGAPHPGADLSARRDRVADERVEPSLDARSSTSCAPTPRWSPSASASPPYLDAEPDKTLAFVAEMDMEAPEGDGRPEHLRRARVHPEVG